MSDIKYKLKGIRICCCGKEIVDHVIEEGSRDHVIYWDTNGSHCSNPKCEKNHVCKGSKNPANYK